jgi:hypothetical protein
VEFLHDDPYVAVTRRLPCSDDALGSLMVVATSRALYCLEPIALEQQVRACERACVCVGGGEGGATGPPPICRAPPCVALRPSPPPPHPLQGPWLPLQGPLGSPGACARCAPLLQVRELLKRKRFQQALELAEVCGQGMAAAGGPWGLPGSASSPAASSGAWLGEALAQTGLLLLLDLQFGEAVQVRRCRWCCDGPACRRRPAWHGTADWSSAAAIRPSHVDDMCQPCWEQQDPWLENLQPQRQRSYRRPALPRARPRCAELS